MPAWVVGLVVGLAGAGLLQAFFYVLRTDWPSNYYSTSDVAGRLFSPTLLRFSAFRFLPVFIIALFLPSYLNPGVEVSIAQCAFLIAHTSLSSGRGLVESIRAGRSSLRFIAPNLLTGFGAILVGLLGWWLAPGSSTVVPGIDKFIEVVTTGLVAAVFSSVALRLTSSTASPSRYVDAFSALDLDLRRLVEMEAAVHEVEREFAFAILLVELEQRPGWLRAAESIPLLRRFARTRGVFQNLRSAPFTNEESVRAEMAMYRSVQLQSNSGVGTPAILRSQLEKHNQSSSFVDAAEVAYGQLQKLTQRRSQGRGDDGNAALRVLAITRSGATWTLRGDCSAVVTGISLTPNGGTGSNFALPAIAARHRQAWHFEFSVFYDKASLKVGYGATWTPNFETIELYLAFE